MSGDLVAWEALLARVLRAPEPSVALAEALAAPDLPERVRGWAAAIDADGLRIGARLVARLRAERLLDGSSAAAALFRDEPAAFGEAFRRYHVEVAPGASPGEEAARWEAWRAGAGGP